MLEVVQIVCLRYTKKNEKRKYADVVIEVFEILMGKKNIFKNDKNTHMNKN